jgi:cytidylate kinase
MSETTSPSLAAALMRAWGYDRPQDEARGPRSTPAAFTIALSREVGARGTSVAREVGARLGWAVYDNELLGRMAREMNLREELFERVDERRQSWILECLESFVARPAVTESVYVRHLVETILSLGSRGECIIVGRGSPHILPAASTLRVRLIADLDDRIGVLSRERGVSWQEAVRLLGKLHRERVHFLRDHFQKDPTDAENYDMVLSTSRFTVAECADLIVEALRRLQARGMEERPKTP